MNYEMPFPIDIKYIIETENELGLIFPDNFKAKMIKENGGELITEGDDWLIFPFLDKSDKKRISRTSNNIILETKRARQWGSFPINGIAIASNGGGDFLILLPTKESDKKLNDGIFTWFHETGIVEKIADSIEELTFTISKPVSKSKVKKQKISSLKTEFGFCIEKIPSPWILSEIIAGNKSAYTFQIGKGTECTVLLETAFPVKQIENDKYWLDQWVRQTGLDHNLEDLLVERTMLDNYSCIVVKSKNWTPVICWFKNNLTDKWYLKMKTGISRHKGDFKELPKLFSCIQIV